MIYPLVRDLAVDGIPVTVTCRVLKIARQPYYRWLAEPVSSSMWVEAHRADALFDAHRDDPEFGHRLLADEARAAGQPMSDRTAWRICRDNACWSAFGRKSGKNGKRSGPPVHDDLVKRAFSAKAPNQLWLADITEHSTAEGKLYLCAVKDAYSGRIVGYSIQSRMKARLAVDAVNNAVARRGSVAGCVLHSDRGSQFRARKLTRALRHHGLVGSMGRVGTAADNAAIESFFALLQKNVLDQQAWHTREQLRIAIITSIERTYHRRRRQARLGRLTPTEYETIMTQTATQAAKNPLSPKRAAVPWEEQGGFESSYVKTSSDAQLHIWIRARHEAVDRLARFSKIAIDAGVADRQVKIAEQMGGVLGNLITAVLGELGLTPAQQAMAPHIAQRQLALVTRSVANIIPLPKTTERE